jgi:YidC/Oxa1 family membrane protein insertase
MKQQQRFLLALVASAAVLILWNYLYPPVKPPQQPNANVNANANVLPGGSPTTSPTAQAQSSATRNSPAAASPSPTPELVPARKLKIVTPLYEATFDTRGAVATSWIIRKNKNNGHDLFGADSTKSDPKPLELIPKLPSDVPAEKVFRAFQLVTGDPNSDQALATRNYRTFGPNAESGDETINVPSGSKQIDFVIHDDATGLDATKRLTFFSDSYTTQLEVKLTRNNQPVPANILAIGPSIGDQGILHHSFYAVPPEGMAVVDGKTQRFPADPIHRNPSGWFSSARPEGPDLQKVGGSVQWAGIGDTYFAMVAVEPRPVSGLEFRTIAYGPDKPEQRYWLTALLPVPADGSKILVYVGPKDHKLLDDASKEIARLGGPQIDLGEAINYGIFAWLRRGLAGPILWSINAMQRLTGSYGIAIILFTIFIYSLFFPLKWQSSRKMKKAQKYAPRMKELQEQLKGMKSTDPRMKELQMEQLRLMKEANPLGGCLPLLIQMPFLFALYSAITISIDFRQASFLWIPDLSGPEPYILSFIRILPVMFCGSMIVLQLLTPAPSADPLQRKMMAIGMPLFMLYILWSAPSGLLLYWLVGNIVGFLQQMLINKMTKEEPPPPEETGTKKKPPPKKLKTAEA